MHKRALVLFFFFLVSISTFSKTDIDSLVVVLKTTKDTTRVKGLLEISDVYLATRPDSALYFSVDAYNLSKKLNYESGLIKSLFAISNAFIQMGKYNNAREKLNEILEEHNKFGQKKERAKILNEIGESYSLQGDYEKAEKYYNDAMQLYVETQDSAYQFVTHNLIAENYYKSENYELALKYYIKASDLAEAIGNKDFEAQSVFYIGNLFLNQGQYDNARKYYEDALKILVKLNDKIQIARIYNNIGLTYDYTNRFDEAIEFYKKALKIIEEIGNQDDIARTLGNIAVVYYLKEDYKSAEEYYLKSLNTYERAGLTKGLAQVKINLGLLYNKTEKYNDAIAVFNEALEISKKLGSTEYMQNCYESLAASYFGSGNYKKAYELLEIHNGLKDSLDQANKSSAIAEIQAKFDLEKKEKAIELLEKDKEISEGNAKRQKVYTLASIFGFALIAVVAFLLYRGYKNKQKTNKQLEEINIQLEKLSIVASGTDNGVIIADANGEMEWINEGFVHMYGYTLEEVKSKWGTNLLEASDNKNLRILLANALKEKKSVLYESVNVAKDGTKKYSQSTLTPITDAVTGELKRIVVIDSDITAQKEVEEKLFERNKDITDSINYAKKIQEAILPKTEKIKEVFPNSFVLFKPKDIVSGDFYWFYDMDEMYALVAAIDCTGHGVPGAFMSMVGSNILNQIVGNSLISRPSKILEMLHEEVRKALKQNVPGSSSRDGMDIALCRVNKKTKVLDYAGANRPLYFFRGEEFVEYKADKRPIGGYQSENYASFANHTIEMKDGDSFFIFSDGYPDQFGGEHGKKFMVKRFQHLLAEIRPLSSDQQENKLNTNIDQWRGSIEQIDDILVIGVKI